MGGKLIKRTKLPSLEFQRAGDGAMPLGANGSHRKREKGVWGKNPPGEESLGFLTRKNRKKRRKILARKNLLKSRREKRSSRKVSGNGPWTVAEENSKL